MRRYNRSTYDLIFLHAMIDFSKSFTHVMASDPSSRSLHERITIAISGIDNR